MNPEGITTTAQVVPLLPPIAMNTNGTLSALPPKTTIVNYTPNLSSWNFSTAPQTALTQKPVTIAAASTFAPMIATTYVPVTQGGSLCTFPAMCTAKYANQAARVEYPSDNKGSSRTAHNKQKRSSPGMEIDTYNGNPLIWHEWCGQFRSAVNSLNSLKVF